MSQRPICNDDPGEEWAEYIDEFEPDDDAAALTWSGIGGWTAAAVRALLDINFRQVSTKTLLPAVYVLGLLGSIAIPIALSVIVFQFSVTLGVIFLLTVAPLLGLMIAASVRLILEFLVNASTLAGRVVHISELADELGQTLAEVAVPVSQLSEDFRAVQFWRFRQRKPARERRS